MHAWWGLGHQRDGQLINLLGPYRLGPGSPAIDACIGVIDHELDGKPRLFDVAGVPTLFVYDNGGVRGPSAGLRARGAAECRVMERTWAI
jgi:hypothetical protein